MTPQAVLLHDQFRPATFQNDLALILLPQPVGRQAVRLVRDGEESLWAPGSGAVVTGWGRTETAESTDALRQAPIAIAPDSLCLRSYAGFGLTFDPAVMLCTGLPSGGPAECNGDSGGPLVVSDGRGAGVQAGVVSWSGKDERNRCGTAGNPGVYARLGALVPGLVAIMRGHPSAPIGDPAALTGSATGVWAAGAVLGGSVTPNGLATHVRVEYGTTPAYGASSPSVYVGAGSRPVPVGIAVNGLAPGTRHHFRLVAEGTAGVAGGPIGPSRRRPRHRNRRCHRARPRRSPPSAVPRLAPRAEEPPGATAWRAPSVRTGSSASAARICSSAAEGRICSSAARGTTCFSGVWETTARTGAPGTTCSPVGPGTTSLIGGPGRDLVRAGAGDDLVLAADGRRDVVDCGPGRDRLVADLIDVLRTCERVTRRGSR